MLDCSQARDMIDLYIDKELDIFSEQELKEHLRQCNDCQELLRSLQKTVALITSLEAPKVSTDFTERLMAKLPAPAKLTLRERLEKQKPYLWRYTAAAAALMIVILSGWFLSQQVPSRPLAITSDQQNTVVREGNKFVVPPGKTITGNLTVVDGSLIIQGKVTGDVTVVRGELEMTPTAEVSGKATTIDQPLARWQYLRLNIAEALQRLAGNLRRTFQR